MMTFASVRCLRPFSLAATLGIFGSGLPLLKEVQNPLRKWCRLDLVERQAVSPPILRTIRVQRRRSRHVAAVSLYVAVSALNPKAAALQPLTGPKIVV